MTADPVDVSFVIPTYRREQQLVEAIKSALAQKDVRVEVIVLDDSGEQTAREAVAAIHDPRVRYVAREIPSRGRPALVRNEGARLARGRFLHFLDDDDRLCEGASKALVETLENNPKAGVAWGCVQPFGDHPEVLAQQTAYFARARERTQRRRSRMAMVATLLFQDTVLVSSACLVRASCFAAVGGFDPNIPVCEDVDFYMRAIRASAFAFLDRPVLQYRTGAPSLMHDLRTGDGKMFASYRRIHGHYRKAHGLLEFYALKALSMAL
jgi:GT2 family glycosyltransferase